MEYASDPAFCHVCGTRLVLRGQPEDGPEPWCPTCGAWRYPGFSVGCSMIVYHPDGKRILTIDQYGKHGILVAGYVARGEDLESTVRREVLEETGLRIEARANPGEVDRLRWVPVADVLGRMPDGSLAQWFVRHHLESVGLA